MRTSIPLLKFKWAVLVLNIDLMHCLVLSQFLWFYRQQVERYFQNLPPAVSMNIMWYYQYFGINCIYIAKENHRLWCITYLCNNKWNSGWYLFRIQCSYQTSLGGKSQANQMNNDNKTYIFLNEASHFQLTFVCYRIFSVS